VPGPRPNDANVETVDMIWPWKNAFRSRGRRCLVVGGGSYKPDKYPGTEKTKEQWVSGSSKTGKRIDQSQAHQTVSTLYITPDVV
jgi:hypothetical protein